MLSRLWRIIPVCLLIASVTGSLSAGDWPDDPAVVVTSFGTGRNGSFVPGLEFEAGGQRVKTWSSGEVIWTSGPENPEGAVPSDGMVVIEHSDGFRSGYLGVEAQPNLDSYLNKDQWIGYAGTDIWTFVIRDSEMDKVIDPLTLLPAREELSNAALGEVTLVSGGESLPVINGMEIDSGQWSLVIDAAFTGRKQAITVELSLYWVGDSVGALRFDSLEEQDGIILIDAPDPVTYDVVYDDEGNLAFRDITLNAGRGTLELRLKDERGTIVRQTWNLSVRSL